MAGSLKHSEPVARRHRVPESTPTTSVKHAKHFVRAPAEGSHNIVSSVGQIVE